MDAEGAEYDMLSMILEEQELDRAGITVCMINVVVNEIFFKNPRFTNQMSQRKSGSLIGLVNSWANDGGPISKPWFV